MSVVVHMGKLKDTHLLVRVWEKELSLSHVHMHAHIHTHRRAGIQIDRQTDRPFYEGE